MASKIKEKPESSSSAETEARDEALITKDTTLGEAITRHPETAEVMLRYGLHCVGCHVAVHETVEQGASAHGMDKDTIEKMVKEMNDVVKKKRDE